MEGDLNAITMLLGGTLENSMETRADTAGSNDVSGKQIEFETEIFIEELRKFGCLWNTSL